MSSNGGHHTFAGILRAEWLEIQTEFVSIVGDFTIEHVDLAPNFIGFTEWRWGADGPTVLQRRHDLLARYERWFERFRLLFVASIEAVETRISESDAFFRGWVARADGNDWSIPKTIDEAVLRARERTDAFRELVDQAAPSSRAGVLAVLDTNCLVRNSELSAYGRLFPNRAVQLVMPPVVLRELDELKDRGRSPDVRDAARRVIRRIKRLRDRGSVLEGVTVEGSTTARHVAIEPDFARVPSWLDSATPDDRLIASTLILQASNPATAVVLVTADLGLATKAEYNGIPTIDPP